MKRGFVVLMLLLIVTLPFVSAGILDIFKRGKIQQSPLDATVSVTNAPSVISQVLDLEDRDVQAVIDDSATPFLDGTNNVVVRFVASDPNGPNSLPGGTEVISLGSLDSAPGGTNMDVFVTGPGTKPSTPVSATSCIRVACPIDATCGAQEIAFECRVPMLYWYEPGVQTWEMSIEIEDSAGTTSGISTDFFTYNSAFGTSDPLPAISFTGISLTTPNQVSDAPHLDIRNIGNVLFITAEVTAYDLKPDSSGVLGSGDDLPIAAFNVGTEIASVCDIGAPTPGVVLGDNTANFPVRTVFSVLDTPTHGFQLDFGDPSTIIDDEELVFCIDQAINTAFPGSYEESVYSTSVGTSCGGGNCKWDLTLTT